MISPENKLKTRTEIPNADLPDNPEKNERNDAIETLKALGALIPVADLETYHGRSTKKDEEPWAVDPGFSNTGGGNVNKITTLYTSDKDTAEEFARDRLYPNFFRPVWQEIKPMFEGRMFEESRKKEAQEQFKEYIQSLREQNKKSHPRYNQLSEPAEQYLRDTVLGRASYYCDITDADVSVLRDHIEKTPNDYSLGMHEITSLFSDATVINGKFALSDLKPQEEGEYWGAMIKLAIPATAGSPVGFDDRDKMSNVVEILRQKTKDDLSDSGKDSFIYKNTAEDTAQESGAPEKSVFQLVGALNAKRMVPMLSLATLARRYVLSKNSDATGENPDVDNVVFDHRKGEAFPVNVEYMRSLLQEAHIVGITQDINSVSLMKAIKSVSFFDLDSTIAVAEREQRRQNTEKYFGRLAIDLSNMISNEIDSDEASTLTSLLHDPFAKPEALVDAIPLKDEYFKNAPSGTWEGYTVGQHTETVLRNFDHNYADKLPAGLLPPMRLAILVHDAGKTFFESTNRQRANIDSTDKILTQKEYNIYVAEQILDKVGYSDRLKKLISALIGDGMDFAHGVNVNKNEDQYRELLTFAEKTLAELYGRPVSEDKIVGFCNMCGILQWVDGGAYTSMAATRDEQRGFYYRNASTFNDSFQPNPKASTNRKLRKKQEASARS